jgi:transposase IS4-like protein
MGIEEWLEDVGRVSPASFEALRSALSIEWVGEALERTGKATIRRRKLPNEAVVWLVIGMALFTNRSVEAVVKHLGLAQEEEEGSRRPSATGSPVTSGGAARARGRSVPSRSKSFSR